MFFFLFVSIENEAMANVYQNISFVIMIAIALMEVMNIIALLLIANKMNIVAKMDDVSIAFGNAVRKRKFE